MHPAISAIAPALVLGAVLAAQQAAVLPPAAMPVADAAALTTGWKLLAEGDPEIVPFAARLLADHPRSVAALALAVEGQIVHGGASASLDLYEVWLGSRTLEEPGVLRRIARAYLYEWGRQTADGAARVAALRTLAEDGDPQAQAVLAAGAGSGGEAELRAMAGLGAASAVDVLVERLSTAPSTLKLREIDNLAATGSPRAVAPLIGMLSDPERENRFAAAEALRRLADPAAIEPLVPLLDDPDGRVRVAAAGALFAMGDYRGASILRELSGAEQASMRRSAARLMASQPDQAWLDMVRGLAADADPAIRLDAAELLSPHDPALSRSLLEELSASPNPEIRIRAQVALADVAVSLADLRVLLRRHGDITVRAAGVILQRTR